jgi:2,3-bisphosphoglycerate-dependent phosphoglycerate mutase
MTELWLVRHGQTDWNFAHRIQGHADIPLNKVGFEQAEVLSQQLVDEHFDAIYSSDLLRASQTAMVAADQLHLQVILDQRLREICHGVWEGMLGSEVDEKFPGHFEQLTLDPYNSSAPGGETIAHVAERMALAANNIAALYPKGKVLVISHGLAVAALFCHANQISFSQTYKLVPENAAPLIINWQVEAPVT